MKQLIATNKDTGQKVQFAWDKPGNPTKEDLDLIFAEKSKGGKEDLMAQNKPVNPPGFQLNTVLNQTLEKASGKVAPARAPSQPAGVDVAAMAQADADRKLGKVNPVQGQNRSVSPQGGDTHNSAVPEQGMIQTLWQKIQDLLGSKTEVQKK